MWQSEYPRRKTRPVRVGAITIGGGHPIVVQSMITAETWDVQRAAEQVMQLWDAGAEIVRITAPNLREAQCIGEIRNILVRKGYRVPLVADVHHQGTDIAVEVAQYVDKIRINPGLFVYRKPRGRADDYTPEEHEQERQAIEEALVPVIEACQKYGIALRIGVNHGSLAERMLVTYGDTPEGMVQSALEYIEICEKYDFRDIVISMKASRVPIMLAANRLLAKRLDETGRDYPIHLGVTEAGDGTYARIKSTAGIATLLAEGIGDTIRVSLAEDPVNEIPVCYDILQALGLRKTQVEYIACPSCGRTKFDLPTVLNEVRNATKHLKGLDIAVMGCLPPQQEVITQQGFTPIECVEAGDQVLDHANGWSTVQAVDRHLFEGELVEIHAAGAPRMLATPQHPVWSIERSGVCKSDRMRWENIENVLHQEPLWYPAEDIRPGMVLLYPILRGERPVAFVPEQSEVAVDEDFLTLAACYVAEGSLGNHRGKHTQIFLHFGSHEPELVERAIAACESLGISVSTRYRPERNTVDVVLSSTEWAERFSMLFGRRAENKRFPNWMLTLPLAQQRYLLNLLWRCDGYWGVVRGYPRANYVTVSSTLAFQVHQMLLRQGIASSLTTREPAGKQKVYTLAVTSAFPLKLFAEIVGWDISIPDSRQHTSQIAIHGKYLFLPVRAVRRICYRGAVYNLDAKPNHTYVASLFITHNCIVNGPGEMADADYGYVGRAAGKIALYRGRQLVKDNIPQERGVEELINLLKQDGKWVEP